jgi:hypothetical protein
MTDHEILQHIMFKQSLIVVLQVMIIVFVVLRPPRIK